MKMRTFPNGVDAEMKVSTQVGLPTFRELAALRIAEAGPRDKTINIKVAINTARMMVESENAQFACQQNTKS